MRRLALLIPVALAGALALASCSGGGTAGQAAGKSASSAPTTQRTTQPAPHDEDTPGKAESPAQVVDGMHYVQLFNTVDPVLTEMAHDAVGGTLPAGTELQNAASSLRQFATQARRLRSSGSAQHTLDQLATASSTLATQLTTLAAKGPKQLSVSSSLNSALTDFQSAAAAARRAAGLPAVQTSPKPQADTGP